MYNTRPLPNHKQSIHPPALPSYLHSYLPAVWKLFNRPPTPTLVPVPSFPIHPQDSSSTTQKELLEPSFTIMAAQQSHTTDPTVSHGRGGECKSWALNRSALTHFEQQVREMCSQIAPRKFLPLQKSVSIVRACEHLFWALRPASPPPHRLRLSPPVPSHDDIILTTLGHYQLCGWRNNSSRTNRRPRRWRILLWRACGWPWWIHSSYWWSGVARRSREHWWNLEGCIWRKNTAWYRCCTPICSQALGGHVSHRGELFALFIFLPSSASMNLISFPANPLYLLFTAPS